MGSCRCGVDQETHSLIANLPNSLLTNKARVGFEAKNCKRVLILVKSLLFYLQVTPYLQQPPFPIYFHPVILLPNKKTTKCLERSQKTVIHTFLSSASTPRTAAWVSTTAMPSRCTIPETELQIHPLPCPQGGTSHQALQPPHLHPHCPWRLLLATLQPLLVHC